MTPPDKLPPVDPVVLKRFDQPDEVRTFEKGRLELVYIPPIPHDSWVVGHERYVSLHFLGASEYAKK